MDIQKGIVKYKDRTDIVCEYGIVSDKQYYFMPEGKLSNGNVIATTSLVEAIDSEIQHLNVGVIDMEGNIVIPFENKSIKPITPEYVLVEKARPTSLSVIASLSSRSDPLAATKLVTTAATKKDSLMTKMGVDGKFVFNDQFSEASVYTNDGENILNGEYYSFIGINDQNIYYSTNVVEDEVYEYSLVKQDNVEVNSADEVVATTDGSSIDVNDVLAQQEEIANTVEEALSNDNEISDDVQSNDEQVIENDIDTPIVTDDKMESNNDTAIVEEETNEESSDFDVNVGDNIEENNIENSSLDENISEESDAIAIDNEIQEEDNAEVADDSSDDNIVIDDEDYDIKDSLIESKEDIKMFDNDDNDNDMFKLKADNYISEKNEGVVPMKNKYYDDNMYHNDSYERENNYYDDNTNRDFEGDTIIKDVASTMTELIRQNRDQRNKINSLENRNDVLDNKIINFESVVNKLEGQKQVLENRNEQMEEKISTQSSIIDRQKDEIEYLRNQLEGKKDLVRLLNDAQSVLRNDNNSYDRDRERDYSYRRVA